ncbi:MAG: ABC transporter substrate-binding protein [Hyphomicrobiales bacterium]|nr:ABC transporter substrate-binding protein [Hyphomicrobiales bacterium]
MNSTTTFLASKPFRRTALALTTAIMLGFSINVTTVEAAPCAAGAVAERAGNALVKAAKSKSASAFASALRKHADMRTIALFALGKHRKKLPKSSEGTYVKLTSSYVSKTLASFSKKFRASSVEAVRCRGKTVESKLNQLGGRPPQKVIFRIKGNKVSDVNVQNVWLAQLLRSNFSSVLKKGGNKMSALFSHLGAGASVVAKLDVR